MRAIDADALNSIKFHPLPYTHIIPDDVNAESYERGWNDAVDAIIKNAPTIKERKAGKWIEITPEEGHDIYTVKCDQCGRYDFFGTNYCGNCGARMER